MLFGELLFRGGFPVEGGDLCLGWVELPALVVGMALKCMGPRDSLHRHGYRVAGGGFKIEEPLPHVPDTTLVKYALLDALAYQEPYGSCFRAFLRSEVEEAILGRTSFVVPVEFAEWMVGIAAIRIDKPEVGLPEECFGCSRLCGPYDASAEFTAG